MLQNMFDKKEEKKGLHIHVFKEAGKRPFEHLDFNQYEVYKVLNFLQATYHEQTELLQKIESIKGFFYFVLIPSVVEPSKMVKSIEERVQKFGQVKMQEEQTQRYLDFISERLPNGPIPVSYVYIVINKTDIKYVKTELSKHQLSISAIKPEKAISITVTYL